MCGVQYRGWVCRVSSGDENVSICMHVFVVGYYNIAYTHAYTYL